MIRYTAAVVHLYGRVPYGLPSISEQRGKALRWHSEFWTPLLRGTIANRTYGIHKNLHVSLFLLTIFGAINYGPP